MTNCLKRKIILFKEINDFQIHLPYIYIYMYSLRKKKFKELKLRIKSRMEIILQNLYLRINCSKME